MRLIEGLGLVTVAVLLTAGVASAAQVGDIQVFYNSTPNFGLGVLDGPVFVFQNTTGTAITDGVLTIVGVDFFDVGTIAAHSNVFVIPGVSDDGQNHGSGNFFTVTGSIYDSSDEAVNADSVEFEFSGKQGSTAIESSDVCGVIAAPIFTPACTQGEANDGTVSNINFLGGPGNNDGPCNNCFGPETVANLIITPTTPPPPSVPEPATFVLAGAGLIGMLGCALLVKRGTVSSGAPLKNSRKFGESCAPLRSRLG